MRKIINKMKKGACDQMVIITDTIYRILRKIFPRVRGGDSGTQIEGLGLTYKAVDDIEYLRNKLLS